MYIKQRTISHNMTCDFLNLSQEKKRIKNFKYGFLSSFFNTMSIKADTIELTLVVFPRIIIIL